MFGSVQLLIDRPSLEQFYLSLWCLRRMPATEPNRIRFSGIGRMDTKDPVVTDKSLTEKDLRGSPFRSGRPDSPYLHGACSTVRCEMPESAGRGRSRTGSMACAPPLPGLFREVAAEPEAPAENPASGSGGALPIHSRGSSPQRRAPGRREGLMCRHRVEGLRGRDKPIPLCTGTQRPAGRLNVPDP